MQINTDINILGGLPDFNLINHFLFNNEKYSEQVGIPLKLTRRSAAIWKCVPLIFDQGVPGGLTSCSGAN
jgi:hypothetical protein